MWAIAWIPSLLGWISRNPGKSLNNFVIYGGIAALVAISSFFYLDYQDAKRDREELKDARAAYEQLTEDVQSVISDYETAERRYNDFVRDGNQFRSDLRRQTEAILDGLSANTIREEAGQDADQATDNATRRFNDALGLFDDATDPGSEPGTATDG